MERPQLVYVGGNDKQPVKCLYLGTDGDKAERTFAAAAADGSNELVRHCMFFEHVRIATPAQDGVPPKGKAATASQPPKPPAGDGAAQQTQVQQPEQ